MHVLQIPGSMNVQNSGTAIYTVAVICAKCGFVSLHALGTLGLMEELGYPTEEAND